MATVDMTALTDQELADLLASAHAEQEKRYTLSVIPQNVNVMNANYLTASGVIAGDAWKQPQGAHDAYPLDWKVTHNGKTWVSTTMSNVWEPPTNWREEVTEGGGYPEWVQPTGAQDAYDTGDRVHYTPTGLNYQSLINANTWSPVAYPAGWSEVV